MDLTTITTLTTGPPSAAVQQPEVDEERGAEVLLQHRQQARRCSRIWLWQRPDGPGGTAIKLFMTVIYEFL